MDAAFGEIANLTHQLQQRRGIVVRRVRPVWISVWIADVLLGVCAKEVIGKA